MLLSYCINLSTLVFKWNLVKIVFVVINWNWVAFIVQLRLGMLFGDPNPNNCADWQGWIDRLFRVIFLFFRCLFPNWVFILVNFFFCLDFDVCFLALWLAGSR